MIKVAMASLILGMSALSPPAAVPPARAVRAEVDVPAVIAAIRAAIAANYVVREKRTALDAALATGLASGRYAGLDPQELSRRVSDDLFAVAHDKHLGLSYQPEVSAELAKGG